MAKPTQHFLKYLWPCLTALFLASCGGNSDTPVIVEGDCSTQGQNEILYSIMHDGYLWYDQAPELDPRGYSDIKTLLEDLKYKRYDKWSYIITQEEYEDYFNSNGGYIGFGFWLTENKHTIRMVYKNSPAYRAGLRGGMVLLEINGKRIQQIEQGGLWGSIYGDTKVGVSGTFKVNNHGEIQEIVIQKDKVTLYSVPFSKILDIQGEKVGYFLFNKFIVPSRDELSSVFASFAREGVTQLIVDLRYNGGGRINTAQYLASLIAGKGHEDEVVASLKHNDRYLSWDESYRLSTENHALNLSTLYVITTEHSCSASELLINGLKPFLEVKVIGQTTCGKPVGMRGYTFCGNHLSPIQFEVFNGQNEGKYYSGLTPQCSAEDNALHAFGDEEESMLKETLHLLKTGHCSPTAAKQKRIFKQNTPINNTMGAWETKMGAR